MNYKKTTSIFLSIFLLLLTTSTVLAQGEVNPEAVPDEPSIELITEDKPLCLPGVYLEEPEDCLPLGTSITLTDLAMKGLFLPFRPLPASNPGTDLVLLEKNYAKLNLLPGVQAAFYPNLESAIAGINAIHFLPPGESLYISYKNTTNANGGHYVQVENNEWVRASPTRYSEFQGLSFSKTPSNSFGWILDGSNPRREPNYQAEVLNIKLERNQIVQVYDKAESGNTTWFMIGLGQWVEQRYIRVVDVMEQAPEGVTNGRWIAVNLEQQTVSVYDNNELVFATIVATGTDPYYTQPGLFQIYEKKEYETMTGAFAAGKTDYYYFENVPWTMYFDQARALHGAYWRAIFGYEQTHGCVNLSVGDSHWLFDWAEVGDWVYVWDPSGRTPTDPSFYGQGGA